MRKLSLLLLLLSGVALADPLSRATFTYTGIATTAPVPTGATQGSWLSGVVAYHVLVRPNSGTLAGAGVLEAYYWTQVPSDPGCAAGCMFRAPVMDCTISAAAAAVTCGSYRTMGAIYGDPSYIVYRPVGVTLAGGGTTLILSYVVAGE